MRKLVITFLLLFISTRLLALGLGNIELNSSLNQPFNARIELLSPTPTEIESLSVRLADLQAFNRAGIERLFILSSLRFEIEINDTGPDYIIITTSEAVREPYLNFLLEASWSSGRLYREYTVLLDPPLYDPNARRAAVPATPVSTPVSQTPADVESSPVSVTPRSVSASSNNNYGPTVSNDTLWSIATQVRPDTGVTVQQMMLALLRSNPQAFISNNINGLREGQILRIPERNEIIQTSAQSALSEVQSQNSMWEEIRGTFASSASQRPAGSATQPSTSTATASPSGDSELRLVSPASDAADSGQASASFDSSGQGGADIALANEQIEALSAENTELRTQLEESETLIQDLQRLLELRDDELAAIQQQTASAGLLDDTTQTAPGEVIDEQPAMDIVPEEITSLALDEPDQAAETPVVEEEPVSEPQPSPPPVVSTQPETVPVESGLVDQILRFVFGNIILVGGALGGLIIAIAALLFIKKRKESAVDDDEIVTSEFPDFDGAAEETDMPEEASEVESEIAASDEAEADKTAFIGDVESDQLVEEVADAVAEEAPQEAAAAEPEEDPLAEVNVFLAYEHFDQAEEFVRDAIKGDPNNLDFHSKLLEVFYSAGEKAKYEEEAKVLQELTGGEGSHWEMATIMWQEISPNRELFAEPAEGEDEASEEAKGGGIVDLTADDESGGEADDGLDFDIGGGEPEKASEDAGDSMLDITAGSDDEDLLDVTAAVGLDEVDKALESSADEENVLDITGESATEDDVLDISASPGGDDDLLDVTAHTDIDAESDEDLLDVTAVGDDSDVDMESTMKIPSAESDDNSLDFDLAGTETADDAEDSEDNVIDFDTATDDTAKGDDDGGIELDLGDEDGTDAGGDDSLEISLDSGGDEDGGDGGIELDMGDAAGDDAGGDDGLEISLDAGEDDGGIELDMGDDAGGDDGLEISLDAGEDDGGIELDMGDDADTDAGGDDGLEISLDTGEDEGSDDGGIELDMGDESDSEAAGDQQVPEISLDDDEDDDDDEDHTVFVPRTADAGEQSAEDEIATKLDLAKAYVELGDNDSAKTIIDEIIAEGNDEQKKQAEELKAQMS